MTPWLYLAIALVFNVSYVYFLKKAEGFTLLWPSVMALLLICVAQYFISRALVAGMGPGLAIAVVSVCVMLGAALMGAFLFAEPVSAQKTLGFALAIVGVAIASLAKA